MQCEEVRNQFTDYLSESLAGPLRSEVQQHLIGCSSCREEAEALKGIWMKLGSIPAEPADTSAMRARFEVMLEAYQHGMDHAPAANWWANLNNFIGKWWPAEPVFQFGLTLALLAAGVVAGRQYRPLTAVSQPAAPAADMAAMRTELHDMRQMVALSLMQQQSASDRLRGVSWSNQIDQPDTEVLNALMDTLMRDPNVNVRLAAVDALKKYGERLIVRKGVVQALARQDSPMVQVALIDYVREIQDKDAVGTLKQISLRTDANETVRKHAALALEELK